MNLLEELVLKYFRLGTRGPKTVDFAALLYSFLYNRSQSHYLLLSNKHAGKPASDWLQALITIC